ncbi:MAG: SurA N-terminal domain-containing protein [Candidatus Omnitrophica bacterium]|nr:SurA N-terminal domain-containing protein [Candidatus Omnitrophota bacterium]
MLRKFHNKKIQKRIWIVLLVFILPGFVVWGFSSSVRSMKETDSGYGKIFNRSISREKYIEAVRAVETQLQMQLGDNFDQVRKLFDLKSMALQRLVMLYEAEKRRIRGSDSELINYIQKDPSFYRKGVFDNNLYEQVIKYGLHLQPRTYEEMSRQNLAIRKLVEEVTREVKVSAEQILEAYNKENEQLSVSYIGAIPADFVQDINPSDAQLKEYFDKNSLQFKKPLSFNLEYLALDSADQIKDLNARIENKETLEKIAKDNNIPVKETGLFAETSPIPGISLSQEISKSLQSLKQGDLLGPMEIEKKFYLFRTKERKEPFIPEFKDIKEEIQARFVKIKSREMAKARIEECAQKIKNLSPGNLIDVDFNKLAKDFSLKSVTTGLFKFGSYIEGVGASDDFFTAAGKLKDNAASGVIELTSGFYIVKLKDKPAVDEKKFSEEKVKFGEKVLNDKKQEFFDKFLTELIKKSQGG